MKLVKEVLFCSGGLGGHTGLERGGRLVLLRLSGLCFPGRSLSRRGWFRSVAARAAVPHQAQLILTGAALPKHRFVNFLGCFFPGHAMARVIFCRPAGRPKPEIIKSINIFEIGFNLMPLPEDPAEPKRRFAVPANECGARSRRPGSQVTLIGQMQAIVFDRRAFKIKLPILNFSTRVSIGPY